MSEENDEVIREQVAGESAGAGAGVAAADVVCYKRGALVTGAIEESRLLNLDLENLYPGSYTVPVSQADGEIVEVSFVRVLPGAVKAEFRAAELSEVVRACGVLGEMVRIPAGRESGERGKLAGKSLGAVLAVQGMISGLLEAAKENDDGRQVMAYEAVLDALTEMLARVADCGLGDNSNPAS